MVLDIRTLDPAAWIRDGRPNALKLAHPRIVSIGAITYNMNMGNVPADVIHECIKHTDINNFEDPDNSRPSEPGSPVIANYRVSTRDVLGYILYKMRGCDYLLVNNARFTLGCLICEIKRLGLDDGPLERIVPINLGALTLLVQNGQRKGGLDELYGFYFDRAPIGSRYPIISARMIADVFFRYMWMGKVAINPACAVDVDSGDIYIDEIPRIPDKRLKKGKPLPMDDWVSMKTGEWTGRSFNDLLSERPMYWYRWVCSERYRTPIEERFAGYVIRNYQLYSKLRFRDTHGLRERRVSELQYYNKVRVLPMDNPSFVCLRKGRYYAYCKKLFHRTSDVVCTKDAMVARSAIDRANALGLSHTLVIDDAKSNSDLGYIVTMRIPEFTACPSATRTVPWIYRDWPRSERDIKVSIKCWIDDLDWVWMTVGRILPTKACKCETAMRLPWKSRKYTKKITVYCSADAAQGIVNTLSSALRRIPDCEVNQSRI